MLGEGGYVTPMATRSVVETMDLTKLANQSGVGGGSDPPQTGTSVE